MSIFANGENVKLGKGALFLAQYVNGQLTALKDLGNATSLTMTADVTKAELYSSHEKSASLLASSIARVLYSMTVTLSEFKVDNLKKFLLATSSVRTADVVTNGTKTFTGALVEPGSYVDLEARDVTGVVVTRDGTELAIAGTDYQLYASEGFIQILEGGAITAGMDLSVEYDAPAATYNKLSVATDSAPVCKLVYQCDDANNEGISAKDRLTIWRVQIAPDGDLPFISDEYASFNLSMSVLSDATNHPDDPIGIYEQKKAA